MLIDRYLRQFDVTEVHEVQVDAPPEVTYAAIPEADLRDSLISALFAVRELPKRIARESCVANRRRRQQSLSPSRM